MLTYGFSFHEIIYKVRRGPLENNGKYRSRHNDGKIGWRNIAGRAQSTLYEWEFDGEGNITAFIQMSPPDYKVVSIPLEKGLLFRTRNNRDNPEGKSLLRNAYRPWYFKKRIEEIEGIGVERDLAGLPVLQAPEGMDLWNDQDERMVALKANAEELIKNIRRDSEEGVLLPFGWDLKLLSTGSSRQFDTNAIINRYDNRIAITMLSDLVLIGGEKTGSFALADTKQSLLSVALESQLNNIADVVNKFAVPKLFMYNNFEGITDYPQLCPGQINTPSLKELALILRSMGLDISKDIELMNFLRKVSSMPELDQDTFKKIYENQVGDANPPKVKNLQRKDTTGTKESKDDATSNYLEQSDMTYTGQ
jgi:hypothetical protein